jgi:hypothetical protein
MGMGNPRTRLHDRRGGTRNHHAMETLMKERYAYVVLATLTVLLSIGSVLVSAHFRNNDDQHISQIIINSNKMYREAILTNDHKFCQVVNGITSIPVPKPADPLSNPSRENQYEWYLRFVALGKSLDCTGIKENS